MKEYLLILKVITGEFFGDLASVPIYASRAVLHLCGCVFLVGFVFLSPVFLPLYAYIQWKNTRLARARFLVTHDFIGDYLRGKYFD